ncbi:MAG: energy transducer TonB [Woeseiaceae bacterium]
MLASRLPLAMGWGGLVSLGMFWVLWNLINTPIQVGDRIEATRIEFTRMLVDSPVVPKPNEKPTHEPMPPPLQIPAIETTKTGVPPTVLNLLPTVDVGGPGRPMPGSDRDVIPWVRVNPVYPPPAIRRGIEGWVKVQFSVTATGMVKDVMVVESEPNGVFDQGTLEAVRRWRYSPKVEAGVAVERVGLQTVIVFELPEE